MSTIAEIVEWLDPDWTVHFRNVEDAAEYYQRYAPEEWAKAARELEGG